MFEDFRKLQVELHETAIKKGGKADTGSFKYSYVTLEEVMDKIMPLLQNNNFVLHQTVGQDNGQPTLTTTLLHKDGEKVESTMLLMLKSPDPQAQGSAITYARRYSLMALLGLVGEDDDGNAAQESATSNIPASDKQRIYISNLMAQKGVKPAEQLTTIAEILGKETTGRLSSAEASKVIEALKAMPDVVAAEVEPEAKIIDDNGQEVPFK